MKKLLLAVLLISASLPTPLTARAPRKKSKESAILRAIIGSFIFCTHSQNLLDKKPLYKTSWFPLVFATVLATHAFKELDDIAQEK